MPESTALKKATASALKSQKMIALLSVAVTVLAVLFLITIIRQEMVAHSNTEVLETVRELKAALSKVQDMQKLQSVSLQRIGGMLTKVLEEKGG
eukprot:TRINITY_DN34449_c0_g1_i1.p2 TRINITY_DN34449_c0_g1~~TRINITY_DN34449_c0_g1_i1.p2  ORF type:complete len:110 (+),score=50.16 TRINITY_DN34449_c0_g1_i1:49-330(+)